MQELIVIGATGFTGRRLCRALKARAIRFDVLVRSTTNTSLVDKFAEKLVCADASDLDELRSALRGYRRCIHLPDLSAVRDAGSYIAVFDESDLQKVVFVSSTNMFTRLPASTKPFREAAETAIISSGLQYVIVRPTMIYGGSDDANVSHLMNMIRRYPILPILDGGTALQQPVFVEDLAKALVDALISDQTDRKIYTISGASVMTFKEMLEQIVNTLEKNTVFVSLPAKPVHAALKLLERFHLPIPFRAEQILRLVEDKHFGHKDAARDFGFSPRSFEEGLKAGYVRE